MKTEKPLLTLEINEGFYVESHSKNIVAYWILQFLLKFGGHRDFIDDRRVRYDDIADFLGVSKLINDDDEFEKDVVIKAMGVLQKQLENTSKPTSEILERNMMKLSELIELSEVDRDVLRFVVYINYYSVLDNAARTISDLTTEKLEFVLSQLLGHTRDEIRTALAPRGRLAQTGIMSVDRSGSRSMQNKIDMGSNSFVDKLMNVDEDIDEMIKDAIRRCDSAPLSIDNYGYLSEQLDVLIPYLHHALNTHQKGVNVLLYGRPGTGKTELVKALAKELQHELYEVSYADEDDDPIEGPRRLRAYRMGQTFLKHRKVLIMFDEIEDVMGESNTDIFGNRKRQSTKGWFNRTLENNIVPCVWITNNVSGMDEAIIRRFDMAIEIPIPPKSKRQEIIESHTASLVEKSYIETIAKNDRIAPALITRAAKVIEAIAHESKDTSKAFELLVDNTLKAQGRRGLEKQISAGALPESYDPSFVNTDHDLRALLEGIREHESARLCLYGAPGTGKSAFGQWIAKELDRPFLLKKGSDLISMWVGGTEKNIANAFKEAMEENAVLVFDEVDSFLQDRRTAKASWEVTQVNEMLVQMENYSGIFIATTNLMEGLDQASLRRFDLKLEFGYLRAHHAVELFEKEASIMGIDDIDKSVIKELGELRTLTPGDFAAVRRQSRFSPLKSASDLLDRLHNEVAIKKQDSSKTMGFLR